MAGVSRMYGQREVGQRLRRARLGSGFKSAATAAQHHGWPEPTYAAREQGTRALNISTATEYAKAFAVPIEYIMYGHPSLPSHTGIKDLNEERLVIIYNYPIKEILPAIANLNRFEVSSSERLRLSRRMAGFETASAAARYFRFGVSTYAAHENGQNRFGRLLAEAYGLAFSVQADWLSGKSGPSGLPTSSEWPDYRWSTPQARPLPPADLTRRGNQLSVSNILRGAKDQTDRQTVTCSVELETSDPAVANCSSLVLRLPLAEEDLSSKNVRAVTLDTVRLSKTWISAGDIVVFQMGSSYDTFDQIIVAECKGKYFLTTVSDLRKAEVAVGKPIKVIRTL